MTFAMSSSWFSFLADDSAGRTRVRDTRPGRSLRERARAFDANQDGAIMLMGLCMACFLIGSLWTIIGIGDAIVFRDSMQEAADHAAFSSASLHAKGMNFISACNLVMMALIFCHILLGMANDVLFFACLIPFVDIAACPLFADAHELYVNYGNDIMKPAATGIHYAEMAAGYGYPWIGALKGYQVGSDYGHELAVNQRDLMVFPISPSLVPGTALNALINSAFADDSLFHRSTGQGSNSEKLGLPVAASPYWDVCEHIAKEGIESLLDMLHVPFLSGSIKKKVASLIGTGIKYRYCNPLGFTGGNSSDLVAAGHPNVGDQMKDAQAALDKKNAAAKDSNKDAVPVTMKGGTSGGGSGGADGEGDETSGQGLAALDPGLDQWWGKDGPEYPWGQTSNGSPWNEVWALNLRPKFTDEQEHAVSIAQRKYGVTSTAEPPIGYFAEAEFYFDCNGKWSDSQCNDGSNQNAGYSIQWRARLRRTEFPQIMDLIGSYAGDFLGNLTSISNAFKGVRNEIVSLLPVKALQGLLAGVTRDLKNMLTTEIGNLGTSLGAAGDSVTRGLGSGIYH